MDGRTDGRSNERTYGRRANGRTDGRTNERTKERTNERKNERKKEGRKRGRKEGRNERTNERTNQRTVTRRRLPGHLRLRVTIREVGPHFAIPFTKNFVHLRTAKGQRGRVAFTTRQPEGRENRSVSLLLVAWLHRLRSILIAYRAF